MRKIYLRLLPFAILTYFLAYIDRINVSFAALTMRGDLGISAAEYGFAFGTFYWGYFIFEVPSNVIMEKVGARLWIARIMISWGILAGLTATVPEPTSFGVVRFCSGLPRQASSPASSCISRIGFRPITMHGSFRLSDRPADRGRRRRADFHRAVRSRRHLRPQRLADHVHRRGHSDDPNWTSHLLCAHGQANAGQVSDTGRKSMAQRQAGVRTKSKEMSSKIQFLARAI